MHNFQLWSTSFRISFWFVLLITLGLASCRSVPRDLSPPLPSQALSPAQSGDLYEFTKVLTGGYEPGESSFYLLNLNREALDWRLALVDQAVRSLDFQYFIWHGDASGNLILNRVLAAADRGVRVRILVDDLMGSGKDEEVAALAKHPKIEIRQFNPNYSRKSTVVGLGVEFLAKFKKLNQRMHNKIVVADNQMCIAGGRNIGDEYFGLSNRFNFRDMDVLGAGPIAREVSRVFDLYWNSPWSYPTSSLTKRPDKFQLQEFRQWIQEELQEEAGLLSSFTLEPKNWENEMDELRKKMIKGRGAIVSDIPSPGEKKESVVLESLADISNQVKEEILIESAYYIPDDDFLEGLRIFDSLKIDVKILTNSLGSNDVSITNSAYRRTRKPTLLAGAELYEAHYFAADKNLHETAPATAKFLGLHSKSIVMDRRISFVGSLNLDPRSININTEMGLIIESQAFGEHLAQVIERDLLPENAFQVTLNDKGKLQWTSVEGTVKKQPARSFGRRLEDLFFGLLPIKSQL